MKTKQNILFVCTGNAGRSQIAEAVFRRAYGKYFNVQSAGVDPWNEIHLVGRALMNDCGYSMEGHTPKHVKTIDFSDVDVIVTIGDPAERGTRELRGGKIHIHWNLKDPAGADDTPDTESVFRKTKLWIENKIDILIKTLSNTSPIDEFQWQPGIATCLFKDDAIGARFSPREHIPILAEKGFKLIELGCYIPGTGFPWKDKKSKKELIEVCDGNGITIWSAHPPENMILMGNDATARHHNIEMLKRFADFCNDIGAALMPIHFWSTTKTLDVARKEMFLDFLIAELESITYDSNVMLCLETLRSNVSKVGNMELLEIVKTHSEHLGLIVDSGHSQISGDLSETVLKAGKLLKSLHLHDNDGTNDLHKVPGDGVIDWRRLSDDLNTANYAGPIMYEVGFIPQAEQLNALDGIMRNYRQFFNV